MIILHFYLRADISGGLENVALSFRFKIPIPHSIYNVNKLYTAICCQRCPQHSVGEPYIGEQ